MHSGPYFVEDKYVLTKDHIVLFLGVLQLILPVIRRALRTKDSGTVLIFSAMVNHHVSLFWSWIINASSLVPFLYKYNLNKINIYSHTSTIFTPGIKKRNSFLS